MSGRAVLLLVVNVALTAKLFTPLGPLLALLGLGYLLVLHASVARGARLVVTASLAAWVAVWIVFKETPAIEGTILGSMPNLGLGGLSIPKVVGVSYVFLKVYDLIRRVQRGEAPPGFVAYLNQMVFAPSFLAGPIAGPEPFERGFAPSRAALGEGVNRILVGVFKLYVLAELVAPFNLFASRDVCTLSAFLTRPQLWLALYAASLWIYLNFAGYSDLAIGCGLLMGVRLPENFDAPYLARNPSEFWQRWHMSFTSWLREHVFEPVSKALVARGQRGGAALVLASGATMVACGLWHRFAVPFLVWGLYHAAVIVAHQLFATRLKPRLGGPLGGFFAGRGYRVLATLATFHAIALGWVLFVPLDAALSEHLRLLERLFIAC